MIAQLLIKLPFQLSIPDGEEFPLFEYKDEECAVCVFPPMASDPPIEEEAAEQQLKVNGVPSFKADILRIDFYKDSFERAKNSECDPPIEFMERAVNSFLTRLRFVARAAQIHPMNLSHETWKLRYLNDDESELEENEALIRGRGAFKHTFSWIALNREVWGNIHTLHHEYAPPAWDGLLLDAGEELPSIGPSVVLAATALEVFISKVLDDLVALNDFPKEVWGWINDRRREPKVEEQYGELLKFLSGHTLKEEQKLWGSFLALKEARNTFVHGGVATLQKEPIDLNKAHELVSAASLIIAKVKEWLPVSMHWPEYNYNFKVQLTKKLI